MCIRDSSISDLEQQLQQLEQENEKYQKILDDTKSDIAEKEEYKSALSLIHILTNRFQTLMLSSVLR